MPLIAGSGRAVRTRLRLLTAGWMAERHTTHQSRRALGDPLSVLEPGTADRRSGFFLFGAYWQGDLGYPKLAEAKEA